MASAWSTKERDRLIDLREAKTTRREIAVVLGRSPGAVREMIRRLKLDRLKAGRPPKFNR